MTWHLDAPAWEAYAAGRLDASAELSVESHLTGCAECRGAARDLVAPAAVAEVWHSVRDTIAAPTPSLAQRVLRRLGVPINDVVVISAADAFLLPWVVAVGFAVVSALVLGLVGLEPSVRDAAFFALTPLVPVLAVVTSYDALDPLREVAESTPYSKLRLALLRAAAALAVALPVTAAIGLVVPHLNDLAAAWIAPSLGLTCAALVLLTWFEAWVTGGLVTLGWATVVVGLHLDHRTDVLATSAAQLGFVAAGAALAVTLVLRTSSLRLQGGER